MAATLAPRPSFVPQVAGDDDPVGVITRTAAGPHRVDLVRLSFWLFYLGLVVAAASFGVAALGAWLLDAAWMGLVPAATAGLVVVAGLVGRARPALG